MRERKGSADLDEVRETPVEQVAASSSRKIDDRTVTVRKLGLNRLIAAAKLLLLATTRMTEAERATLVTLSQAATKGGLGEVSAGLLSVLTVFDEDTVRRLFGAILDEDAAWCGEHIGPADALWAIDALLEHNDLEEMKETFFHLVARFKTSPAPT